MFRLQSHSALAAPLQLCVLGLALSANSGVAAELKPAAQAAWEKYVSLTEARIRSERESAPQAPTGIAITRMLTTDPGGRPIPAEDAMIHHWKGSVFVPGVDLDEVLKFVQDYDQHQRFFKEVEKSRLVSRSGDTFDIFYRLKRTKVITVVYNTEHKVVYSRDGPGRVSSRSATTRIAELDKAGTAAEKEKPAAKDYGFLWHLNSYWRFIERQGGVVVECESISLSRSIPTGLGWLIRSFVESVPRESLTNTLTSLRDGLKRAAR